MYRPIRAGIAAISLAATLIGGTQLIAGVAAEAQSSTVRATTSVNVRKGPSTSTAILGVLYQGESVTQVGPATNGWVPVLYRGTRAYILGTYLSSSASSSRPETSSTTTTSAATRYTTDNLRLRTSPSLTARVVTVLPKGTALRTTGHVSGTWTQVTYGGRLGWVSTQYLSAAKITTTTIVTTATKRAILTDAVNLRTAPSMSSTVVTVLVKGTIVDIIGVIKNGFHEIVWQGAPRWLKSDFVRLVSTTSTVSVPATPKTIGVRYATATLDIRTSSGSDATTLTQVPAGTAVSITGVVQNGRAQIVYAGAVRWVTASLLSATQVSSGTLNTNGSSGLDALTTSAKGIVYAVRANFPQIKTMYGVRPDYLPDHPSGHAVDIMLPNYTQNAALGYAIAEYMKAHASELNIKYIIFHQHIWSVARASEGWRLMADRGSDNANHMNHVHVTVN